MSSQVLQAEVVEVEEPDVIALSASKLRRRNPDVAAEVINDLVSAAYHRLTPAKVRTFLPILIVREVSEKLRVRQDV